MHHLLIKVAFYILLFVIHPLGSLIVKLQVNVNSFVETVLKVEIKNVIMVILLDA